MRFRITSHRLFSHSIRLCLNYTLHMRAESCLLFADKSWSLSRQLRQAGATSEGKVSLRIAMASDFVSPVSSPQSRILFQFLERRKKRRYVRTYVRIRTYARRRTINVTGRALRNQRRAINHVSRVLKSTSKFSFKSHAVRFIKEHYWSPLLCNSCTRRPEIRAYVLSPFLIFSLSLHLPHYYSTSIHYYPVAPIYISRMHTLSRGLDYKLTT